MLSNSLNSRVPSECETSCLLSQNKEASQSKAALETTLQAFSMNLVPTPAMEERYAQPGRKRVKIKEEDIDKTAINKIDGNDFGASLGTRSVSSNMYVQGNQHRPASFFFRCMNFAIHFFIYFLSIACSVIPQLQLPILKFPKLFEKAKLTKNKKDL